LARTYIKWSLTSSNEGLWPGSGARPLEGWLISLPGASKAPLGPLWRKKTLRVFGPLVGLEASPSLCPPGKQSRARAWLWHSLREPKGNFCPSGLAEAPPALTCFLSRAHRAWPSTATLAAGKEGVSPLCFDFSVKNTPPTKRNEQSPNSGRKVPEGPWPPTGPPALLLYP